MVFYFLSIGGKLELPQPLIHDGICKKITFKSATLDLEPQPDKDQSSLNLHCASGDILLHMAFRRRLNIVAFTSQFDGKWAKEEQIPFEGLFTSGGPNAIITVRAEACGYLVMFDEDKGYFYNRRGKDPVVQLSHYTENPMFSNPIIVEPEYTTTNCSTCGASNFVKPEYRQNNLSDDTREAHS